MSLLTQSNMVKMFLHVKCAPLHEAGAVAPEPVGGAVAQGERNKEEWKQEQTRYLMSAEKRRRGRRSCRQQEDVSHDCGSPQKMKMLRKSDSALAVFSVFSLTFL